MSRSAITRIDVKAKTSEKKTDWVAQEKPLYIFFDKAHCITVFCSPTNLKELAIGHLLTEGFVKSLGEISELNLKREKKTCRVELRLSIDAEARLKLRQPFSRIVYSACGSSSPLQFLGRLPRVRSSMKVKSRTIQQCVKSLNFKAEIFRKTGGVHAAAVYAGNGKVLALAEDVGRHNAVDKVIGIAALANTNFGLCFLALSGRLSADIVLKTGRVGIPIVASLAAGIDSGIALARRTNLTLIGFVRGKRMNIYTFPERILL